MGKWSDLAANLKKRDQQQIEDMNIYCGGWPTIENRIALADGRAADALAALMQVLAHLDEQDSKTPNAEVSGPGERSSHGSA